MRGFDSENGGVSRVHPPRLCERSEAIQESVRWPLDCFAALAITVLVTLCAPAQAADKRFPDWPCKQIKVPELSVTSVWTGDAFETGSATWKQDAGLGDLVPVLAARRTDLEAADKAIADYAAALPAGERKAKLTALFAALFDSLNAQRSDVMNGIERYSKKQKQLAEKVREDTRLMQAGQDAPGADQAALEEKVKAIEWDLRVFDDRQKSLSAVCEAPVLIEQRLGALGKSVLKAMQ